MKVPIVYFAEKNADFTELVKGMEEGLKKQGHETEIIDFQKGTRALSSYKFIAIGYNCISLFGGKISGHFLSRLKSYDMIKGRFFSVFSDQKFGSASTLYNLMKFIESQGGIVCSSGIFKTKKDALAAGEKIHVYDS